MINELQKRSRERYAKLMKTSGHLTTSVGRLEKDADKEEAIWRDILKKIDVSAPNPRVLDIGCGFGVLTQKWIERAVLGEVQLFLNDIPEVIEKVRTEFLNDRAGGVQLVPGIFPDEVPGVFLSQNRFDIVLLYSVIHYTAEPLALIDAAAALVEPGGRLLVGDIPNVNKKGRFLASEFGRKFEAEYRGCPPSEIKRFLDHHSFVSQYETPAPAINDALVTSILSSYRYRGWDVYVLPQPSDLPFSYTREDLLLCRPQA